MGIDVDGGVIRVKTREVVRGAMLAAAHALVQAARVLIRASTEQCRHKGMSMDTLTETATQLSQCSETLLG